MTTTQQHTAGPWKVVEATVQSEEYVICDCDGFGDGAAPQIEANARLVAAAPDLLDALEELVERDRAEAAEAGFTDDEMTWLEDARRAIAKAKGGAA